MLVQLKRDWYDATGVFHQVRNGLAELPDDYDLGRSETDEVTKKITYDNLPQDAVVVSSTGALPSPSVIARPGFQAKPLNEQLLDLIPGAGLSDQEVLDPKTPDTKDVAKTTAAADAVVKTVADNGGIVTEQTVADATKAAGSAVSSVPETKPVTPAKAK